MNQHKKLNAEQQQEHLVEHQATQNSTREFSTVEELLRHDAAQTSAPASLAQRLQKSSADFPKPSRPWWQRLLGQ